MALIEQPKKKKERYFKRLLRCPFCGGRFYLVKNVRYKTWSICHDKEGYCPVDRVRNGYPTIKKTIDEANTRSKYYLV